jgi:hypothetical protein
MVMGGGGWTGISAHLRSSAHADIDPTIDHPSVGFRLATIPEPATVTLAAFGRAALAAYGWQRKR